MRRDDTKYIQRTFGSARKETAFLTSSLRSGVVIAVMMVGFLTKLQSKSLYIAFAFTGDSGNHNGRLPARLFAGRLSACCHECSLFRQKFSALDSFIHP